MKLREHVEQVVWPRRGLRGYVEQAALRPLSTVFGLAVAARNLAYDVGIFRAQRAGAPVVSVGNLAIGGTGKTPMTRWLGHALIDRGFHVAIVLRGYGGAATDVTVVSRGNGPEVDVLRAGDESVMLAKSFRGAVLTAARRIAGVRAAIALGANVIVLDDGFQHRALARDFDLVLVDGRRGPLLPSGPLRESVRALRRADAVLMTGDAAANDGSPVPNSNAVFRMHVEPTALVESVAGHWTEHPLGALVGKRVVAVAGIARPERFYDTLTQWEAVIADVFEFRDHHQYTSPEWHTVARRGHDADLIVTTEKDLVKLERFPFEAGKLVALRIAPVIERGDELIDTIVHRIAGLVSPGTLV